MSKGYFYDTKAQGELKFSEVGRLNQYQGYVDFLALESKVDLYKDKLGFKTDIYIEEVPNDEDYTYNFAMLLVKLDNLRNIKKNETYSIDYCEKKILALKDLKKTFNKQLSKSKKLLEKVKKDIAASADFFEEIIKNLQAIKRNEELWDEFEKTNNKLLSKIKNLINGLTIEKIEATKESISKIKEEVNEDIEKIKFRANFLRELAKNMRSKAKETKKKYMIDAYIALAKKYDALSKKFTSLAEENAIAVGLLSTKKLEAKIKKILKK